MTKTLYLTYYKDKEMIKYQNFSNSYKKVIIMKLIQRMTNNIVQKNKMI